MPQQARTGSVHASTVQLQTQVELHAVSEDSYTHLRLIDKTYPYWIVSHVLNGEVETVTGDKIYMARSGDVMIHPPHVPFSEITDRPGTHQWFGLNVVMLPKLDLLRFYPVSFVVPLQSPQTFSGMFGLLREVWTKPAAEVSRDLAAASYASALVAYVLDSWRHAGSPPRESIRGMHQDRYNEIIHYMFEHMDRKLTRAELAEMLHLHPVYLDRAFVECFGLTPMKMLREFRLRRARQMLETGMEPLAQVAAACGFNDAAHLSRSFAAHYGVAPGEYRERAKSIRRGYME